MVAGQLEYINVIGWDKTIHNIHISIIINESITKTNHIYIYIGMGVN